MDSRDTGLGLRTDPDLKKELAATIQVRKDLGEEYEAALVDSFLEQLDQRIDSQVERRVRRELAQTRTASARPGRRPDAGPDLDGRAGRYIVAGVSLVTAIPLSAIAAGTAGARGLVVTWVGIVGVNAAHSLAKLFSQGRDRRGDRDRDRDRDAWD